MSEASRECIFIFNGGACCRETNVNYYVMSDEKRTLYYVACKEHEKLIKVDNEKHGFSVSLYVTNKKVNDDDNNKKTAPESTFSD